MEEVKEIRAFNVTKDNWTGLLSMVGGLYDFLEDLRKDGKVPGSPKGNLKLIHILDKIIFDDMKDKKSGAAFTEGSMWTAPRVTFLSMMKLKDGFSTGQSEQN